MSPLICDILLLMMISQLFGGRFVWIVNLSAGFGFGGTGFINEYHYEPGAELELNLTRYFRFAIGATYRFTTEFEVGTNLPPTVRAEALKGFSYMVTFKFGRFQVQYF